MPDPEQLTRYVGAGIALIGAFVVSPTGAAQLFSPAITRTKRLSRSALDRFKRWTPWLPWPARRPPQIVSGQVVGKITLSGSVQVQVPWDPSASIERKIELLDRRFEHLRQDVDLLTSQVKDNDQAAKQALADAEQRLTGAVNALGKRQDEAEERAAQVDARALPVVGIGVLLSTVPDLFVWLCRWTAPLYVVLASASALAARAVWLARRDSKARRVSGAPAT
jgi:hypothetical protein